MQYKSSLDTFSSVCVFLYIYICLYIHIKFMPVLLNQHPNLDTNFQWNVSGRWRLHSWGSKPETTKKINKSHTGLRPTTAYLFTEHAQQAEVHGHYRSFPLFPICSFPSPSRKLLLRVKNNAAHNMRGYISSGESLEIAGHPPLCVCAWKWLPLTQVPWNPTHSI